MSAASIVRDVQVYDFTGPTQIVVGFEPVDLTTGTETQQQTTVTNERRLHILFTDDLIGSGPGVDTGVQYDAAVHFRAVQNDSQVNGSGVTQIISHAQATSAEDGTVRQLYIAHFQVLPSGEIRSFERTV